MTSRREDSFDRENLSPTCEIKMRRSKCRPSAVPFSAEKRSPFGDEVHSHPRSRGARETQLVTKNPQHVDTFTDMHTYFLVLLARSINVITKHISSPSPAVFLVNHHPPQSLHKPSSTLRLQATKHCTGNRYTPLSPFRSNQSTPCCRPHQIRKELRSS